MGRRQGSLEGTWAFAAVLAFGAASLLAFPAAPVVAQEVVYVVRHAEQVADVDDPPLSEEGKARARVLREFFRDAGLTAVYATDLRRTMETGASVTEPLGFEVTPVDTDSLDGLVARAQREQPHGRVLIIGHSNTVPGVLEQFGYPDEITIEHDEFDNLFIVVDGAAVGANLGVNPSLSITAMSERAMAMWPNKDEADPRPGLGTGYRVVEPVRPNNPAVDPSVLGIDP